MPLPALSVVGLGKLGAPFAAVMAAKGFKVMGVDKNEKFVRALNAGHAPVEEPLLQAFISKARRNLTATRDMQQAVLASSISFIIVPTPSGPDGMFSNAFVLDAVTNIAKILRQKKTRHIIVVTSTVMPGSSDSVMRAAIEKASGRKVGVDVGYCYNPEFIALGSVIHDMLHPDFILIGESDERSGKAVANVYKEVCGATVPLQRMALVNAEITKIAINTFVTTKISYANMLADICERLPGADIDVVSCAVGSDSRVGRKYLKGATAYGGPCFPRDNIALSRLARKLGAKADVPIATDKINNYQTERLVKLIAKHVPRKAHIGIAGMAYKPDTPVVERSASVALAAALLKKRFKVSITDPRAAKNAKDALRGKVTVAADIKTLAGRVDLLVVATTAPEYQGLTPSALRGRKKPLIILDCWRAYKDRTFGKMAQLIFVGCGPHT